MNIAEIKKIIDSDLPEEYKRTAILNSICKDDNALPDLLEMLHEERRFKHEALRLAYIELTKYVEVIQKK